MEAGERGDDSAMDELLSEITPLPWRQSKSGLRAIAGEPPAIISDPDIVIVVDADAKTAASTQNWADHYTRTANIRYIVRACNAFPKLLAACEAVINGPTGYDNLDDANDYDWERQKINKMVRDAIAAANGGES